MIRWIRDVEPLELRALAEGLDFGAVVLTGRSDVIGLHLAHWVLFARCAVFAVAERPAEYAATLAETAFSYDMPPNLQLLERFLRVVRPGAELGSLLRSALSSHERIAHWHFAGHGCRIEAGTERAAAAAAAEIRTALPNCNLSSYLVQQDANANTSRTSRASTGRLDVRLPLLLPPSSTRRALGTPWPHAEVMGSGCEVAPVDHAISFLLELALDNEPELRGLWASKADIARATRGLNDEPAPELDAPNGVPRASVEDIATYAMAHRPRHHGRASLKRIELSTPRGPLLVLHGGDETRHLPPVLVVNAFGMPTETVEPLMASLSDRYCPITWQSRQVPAWQEQEVPSLLQTELDDLTWLLRHLGGPIDIIGWCNGAAIALDVAARHPGHVTRVILLNGVFPTAAPPKTAYHQKLAQLLPVLGRSRASCALYCNSVYGTERVAVNSGPSAGPRLNHLLSRPFRAREALFRYANHYTQFWGIGSTEKRSLCPAARHLRGKVSFAVARGDDIAPIETTRSFTKHLGFGRIKVEEAGDHYSLYHDPVALLRFLDLH